MAPVADPQSLLEEKETLVEKLAITEYELRLAQEDATKLKGELQKKTDTTPTELNGMSQLCFTCNAYVLWSLYCET